MKKETFKSYEDLPLMLSVPEMATALGISRAGAYELARSEGFPALRIGTRRRTMIDMFFTCSCYLVFVCKNEILTTRKERLHLDHAVHKTVRKNLLLQI